MKKAGIVTIAIVLFVTGVIVLYCFTDGNKKKIDDGQQGTLVKESFEWKKYYM